MFPHFVALDLVGEAVHVLLQMLHYFIRLQRRLEHLVMLRKFQSKAPLVNFKLPFALEIRE